MTNYTVERDSGRDADVSSSGNMNEAGARIRSALYSYS